MWQLIADARLMMTRPRLQRIGRHLQLLLLAAAIWAVVFGRFTLGPLQEALRSDLGLSDDQIAWLLGAAVAIPMTLGSIPIGLLVDRYSRARMLWLLMIGNLAACALAAVSWDLPTLFLARLLSGIALAGALVAGYSMVSDLYPPEQRGRATMVMSIGEIGGAPAAFALGGLVLGSSAAITGVYDWREALLWMCVPLVPTVIFMFALREPARTGIATKSPPLREVWPAFWRYRGVVLPLLLARIMVWLADGAVLVWGAPSFSRTFALSPDQIGAIMASALLISGILGPVLGGPLADWCQQSGGPRRTMAALCILAVLSTPVGLFAIMPSPEAAHVVLTLFLTLHFTVGTAAIALASVVIPGELRGLFFAVQITIGATFSIGAAPLVVSSLSGALGGPHRIGEALAIVCAATSVIGALVFGLGKRNFPGLERPRSADTALPLNKHQAPYKRDHADLTT